MHRTYSVQLTYAGQDGSGKATAREILNRTTAWINSTFKRTAPGVAPLETGRKLIKGDVKVVPTYHEAGRAGIAAVEYEHPDDEDNAKRWRVITRVAWYGSACEATVELLAGFPGRVLAPTPTRLRPPRLIQSLAEIPGCIAGGQPVRTAPRMLNSDTAEWIGTHLRSDTRDLPAIVIAPDPDTGKPWADSGMMARALTGLAEVCVLEDADAVRTFRRILGPSLAVFNGGMRLYWPRFRLDDAPRRHPLILGSMLHNADGPRNGPLYWMQGKVVEQANLAFRESGIFQQAREELQLEALRKFQATEDSAALRKAYTELQDENTRLRAERDDANERLQNTLASWNETAAQQGSLNIVTAADLKQARTCDEVLKVVERDMPNLIITNKAYRTSQGYQSPWLLKLYSCLDILQDLAEDYYKDDKKSIGVPLEAWLTDQVKRRELDNVDVRQHESPTTRGMFGSEREIVYHNRKWKMEKHFTIGKGNSGCIHLYWDFSDTDQGIVIGYTGVHLSHVGTA